MCIRDRPQPGGALPDFDISSESDDLRWWPVNALPADDGTEIESLVAAALAQLEARQQR